MVKQDYEAHIQRIIYSKGFGHSKTYASLLSYILHASVKGQVPKEISIAIDVFGKDENYNPAQDTLVRVYMYNLRKKLKYYYEHEGKEESYQITIPKGKYEAIFAEPECISSKASKQGSIPLQWMVGLVILILIFGALNFWLFKLGNVEEQDKTVADSEIWAGFIQPEGMTLSIVMGDIFLFEEYDTLLGRMRMVRDSWINSADDLESLVNSDPRLSDRNLSIAENPLLTKSQVFSLKSLIPVVGEMSDDFFIRVMSRINSEELHDRDLIFIGLYKTLGLLEYVFDSSHFFLTTPYTELVHEPTSEVIYQEGNPLARHKDYGYLAKVNGPNNNQIMIISSFTDTGIMQVINQITRPASILELEQSISAELGKVPPEWEVLFEVGGYDRINLMANIKYVYER